MTPAIRQMLTDVYFAVKETDTTKFHSALLKLKTCGDLVFGPIAEDALNGSQNAVDFFARYGEETAAQN